jgi:hypothetical protein
VVVFLYDHDAIIYMVFIWHSDLVGLNTGERRKSNVCISIILLSNPGDASGLDITSMTWYEPI